MQTETVTRVRAGSKPDRFSGETTLDWANATETDFTTVAPAEPLASAEAPEPGRLPVVSGYRLYLPPGSDFAATDRVRVRGELHQVDGVPGVWAGAGVVVATSLIAG